MALRDSIADTANYVAQALIKEPVTYVNTAAMAVSMSSLETQIKLVFYCVSIIASLLVSIKYILEIRKLRNEHNEGESNHGH